VLNLASKIFGSSNDRALKTLGRHVPAINALESRYEPMSDRELQSQTASFRQRLENGEPLNNIAHEAFAVVREAAKRTLGQRPYDVQLIGGLTLHEGKMRRRFHREPMIQACELLLQERIPRDVAISHPRAEEAQASSHTTHSEPSSVRHLSPGAAGAPNTHLLSNGRYAVMLTAAGSGYSRWKDIAITRWREDSTRDNWGSYVFLRDVASGESWSASAQPLGRTKA